MKNCEAQLVPNSEAQLVKNCKARLVTNCEAQLVTNCEAQMMTKPGNGVRVLWAVAVQGQGIYHALCYS